MEKKRVKLKIGNLKFSVFTRYRDGRGDFVVFIHGLGCSSKNFINAFSDANYRDRPLLALDLVGFGSSTGPRDFSYKMEDHAAVCESVINVFSRNDIHIVAHSMGGAIALLLSTGMIKRVKSFASLEGNLIGEDCFLSRKAAGRSFDDFNKKFYPALFKGIGLSKEQLSDLSDARPAAFYRSSKSLVDFSDSGRLLQKYKKLKCRHAYFYGERNSGIQALSRLSDEIRIKISNSGHFMMLDNPEEFYSELYRFQFENPS